MSSLILFISRFIVSNFNEFLGKNGPYMSAAIAYYAFFALFPLSLALIAVFSLVLHIEGFEEQLIEGLRIQIPVLAEADDEFLGNFFQSISRGRAVGSVVAIVGLFWVSQQVFSAIRKSINVIWGIEKTRPFLTERLMDIALMFGAATLLFASVFITGLLTFFQELSAILLPDAPISDPALWRQFALLVPLLLSFSVFLTLYWWLPNTKLRFRDVWPTALAGAAGLWLFGDRYPGADDGRTWRFRHLHPHCHTRTGSHRSGAGIRRWAPAGRRRKHADFRVPGLRYLLRGEQLG